MAGRFGLAGLLSALSLFLAVPAHAQPGALADWAAVVVAGDWHAHSGGPSEAFDNARRDVSLALNAAGFTAANFSAVRPPGNDYDVVSQSQPAGASRSCLTATVSVDN